MGKASKWIRNLLIGKKEERYKQKDSSFSTETSATATAIVPATPKVKRRWSFGRSANADATILKSARSFNLSIATSQQVTQTLLEYENEHNCAMVVPMIINEDIKTIIGAKPAPPGPVENAAATKIQSIFRSYLARRALLALRGLVKLQALVRGHLMRKRTTATMRCMHALISIQVRARVQRIQMAEEAELHHKRKISQRELFVQENEHRKAYSSEKKDVNFDKKKAGFKSKSNHPQIQRMEQEFNTHHVGKLSISKREHQFQICPNPSAFTDLNSRIYNSQFGEHSSTTSWRSSQYNSPVAKTNQMRAPFSIPLSDCVDHLSHHYPWLPNYMSNTESSKAKVRSHSEPKQRPKGNLKPKSRRSTSSEHMDIHMQHSSSEVRTNAEKNHYPWLIKLHRSTKTAMKDSECHSISTTTNRSNNCKSLISYEPPVNLY